MADEIEDKIREAVEGPASVTTDAGSVTAQPIPDLIEADRYLAGKDAAKKKHRGIRFAKLIPPGSV